MLGATDYIIIAAYFSLTSMYNSASSLVARELVARFRAQTSARAQILIGQVALLLVMVGGILSTPLSSFVALMVVSRVTAPPPEAVRTGAFAFSWIVGEGESPWDLRIAGTWMRILFLIVTGLWWCFR